MDHLDILDDCVFISVEEASAILKEDVATTRRYFGRLRDQGLATYRVVGRAGHREQRWCLSTLGVQHRYPEGDHPWRHTLRGLRALLQRIEMLRALYRSIPGVFTGEGANWHGEPQTPSLVGCVLIRGPHGRRGRRSVGLIQAVLNYTNDIVIFVCWVGTEHRVPDMLDKWESRFIQMRTHSLDDYLDLGRNALLEPPDPDHDWVPRPSGYLILGPDYWSLLSAHWHLPWEGYRGAPQPRRFIESKRLTGFHVGVVEARPHDQIEEYAALQPHLGENLLRVVRPDHPPVPEDLLGAAVPSRILDLVAEWSGFRRKDLARRLSRSKPRVIDPTVDEMIQGKWLQEVGGMLYLDQTGILYVARRDRVHDASVRTRVESAIAQDHRKVAPHRNHTVAANVLMIRLHESGIAAYAGWRAVRDLGYTQLAPDLVIVAASELGAGVHYIEVERTARYPEQIWDKIYPHQLAFTNGVEAKVIFILERPEVESRFQNQGEGIPLLTSTMRDVRRGPLLGFETAWRFRGQPTWLL